MVLSTLEPNTMAHIGKAGSEKVKGVVDCLSVVVGRACDIAVSDSRVFPLWVVASVNWTSIVEVDSMVVRYLNQCSVI